MSKHTCFLLIVFFSLLGLAVAGASTGQTPVIHENPANLTTQQPFDVNGKLMLQLEQMFGSLDKVALNINLSQFDLSRLSLKDYDLYYQFFKDYLARTSITGSDYQRITGQANVTAEQLRGMIESSESFNAGFARFKACYDRGDMVNATITALELQKQYDAMNGSSRQLTLTAAAISALLQNTSVNTNRLDEGINTLNIFMDRMNELNTLPMSLLGNTNLTLEASKFNVSTGDVVAFTARLSSNDTAVAGGLVELYVDGASAGRLATGSDGTCIVFYQIAAGSFNGTYRAIAYYDPQGSNYTPAVSNGIGLNRLPITADLTMTAMPETVRFGDTAHVEGRLTADGGYPVPGHVVSVYYGRQPACYAVTDGNGYYACGITITARMPEGFFDTVARYEAESAPGEALANASSQTSVVRVLREGTLLTLEQPPSFVDGGQNIIFAGTIISSSGRPVNGVEIGIYDDSGLIVSGTTDDRGYFRATKHVSFGDAAGMRRIYAAYRPEAGLSLEGSQSDGYDVTYRPVTPEIAVSGVPQYAFRGDIVTLSGRVTAPDGTGIEGLALTARAPNATLGRLVTGDNGTFRLEYKIDLAAGSQAITVDCDRDNLLGPASADAGSMYVLPFDLLTSLAIVAIVLLVVGLTIGRITRADRALGRRLARLLSRDRRPGKATLPKPTLKVTPPPEPPAGWGIRPEPTRFEDEVTRINTIIAGGADYREVIAEIYLAARRITGARGFVIAESATHREFYRKLVAREPRLNVSAGTITRHYESAVFGHKPLSEKDIVGSLYSLKEINTLMTGEPAGGSA
jgi:hypothetical protein